MPSSRLIPIAAGLFVVPGGMQCYSPPVLQPPRALFAVPGGMLREDPTIIQKAKKMGAKGAGQRCYFIEPPIPLQPALQHIDLVIHHHQKKH